jgi:hypothetical protein
MRANVLKHGLKGIACGALLLVLGGCPKHENLPTAIDVVEAPVPSTFVITAPAGPDPQGNYTYDLSWTTTDPGATKGYRLYLVEGGFVPELLAEVTGNQLTQSLPVNAVGLHFGLSAVSTDNIETAMVVKVVPPTGP